LAKIGIFAGIKNSLKNKKKCRNLAKFGTLVDDAGVEPATR